MGFNLGFKGLRNVIQLTHYTLELNSLVTLLDFTVELFRFHSLFPVLNIIKLFVFTGRLMHGIC